MIKLWMNVAFALVGTTTIVATNHGLDAEGSACAPGAICKKVCDGPPGECIICPDGSCCRRGPDGKCIPCTPQECKQAGCNPESAKCKSMKTRLAGSVVPQKCNKELAKVGKGSTPCCSGPTTPCCAK